MSYETLQSLTIVHGADLKGNLCIVLTLNGREYVMGPNAAKEISQGINKALADFDLRATKEIRTKEGLSNI